MKTRVLLTLTLSFVLPLLVAGCGDKARTAGAGEEVATRSTGTTAASVVVPFDPALLGTWHAVGTIPEQNLDYLGTDLDFRVTNDDRGNPVGQLLTPWGNGTMGYGDLYARDGVMRLGTDIEEEHVLEATYTVEGDTLTIVPAAVTKLAPVTYRRVAK
jgi:hypothetical protein